MWKTWKTEGHFKCLKNLVREENNEMAQMKPMVKMVMKTSHDDPKDRLVELKGK